MNKVFYFVATIYKMYLSKRLDIPHFRTIMSLVLLLFLSGSIIVLIFDIPIKWIIIWNPSEKKPLRWAKGLVYFGFLAFILNFVFARRKLDMIEVTEKSIANIKKILPIYFISVLILLIILLYFRGVRMGLIR
jgi:hypothetical protein